MDAAVQTVLQILYKDQPPPTKPLPNRVSPKQKRNEEIRARYKAGETLEQLAKEYGVSFQRIQQIIKGRHR
jgi:Mor family transcriptional regulator